MKKLGKILVLFAIVMNFGAVSAMAVETNELPCTANSDTTATGDVAVPGQPKADTPKSDSKEAK